MSKELHLITGEGKMGQCDLYPKGSLHIVEVNESGKRMTRNGRDSIHHDIGSEKLNLSESGFAPVLEGGKKCEGGCQNTFKKHTKFHSEKMCIRCFEKRTKVNRY